MMISPHKREKMVTFLRELAETGLPSEMQASESYEQAPSLVKWSHWCGASDGGWFNGTFATYPTTHVHRNEALKLLKEARAMIQAQEQQGHQKEAEEASR